MKDKVYNFLEKFFHRSGTIMMVLVVVCITVLIIANLSRWMF
jgi:hypothetical protein